VAGIMGFAVTVVCRWKSDARVLGRRVRVGRRGESGEGRRGARDGSEGRSERRARGCRGDGVRSVDGGSRGGIAPDMAVAVGSS
jgi:hypothetical protein